MMWTFRLGGRGCETWREVLGFGRERGRKDIVVVFALSLSFTGILDRLYRVLETQNTPTDRALGWTKSVQIGVHRIFRPKSDLT